MQVWVEQKLCLFFQNKFQTKVLQTYKHISMNNNTHFLSSGAQRSSSSNKTRQNRVRKQLERPKRCVTLEASFNLTARRMCCRYWFIGASLWLWNSRRKVGFLASICIVRSGSIHSLEELKWQSKYLRCFALLSKVGRWDGVLAGAALNLAVWALFIIWALCASAAQTWDAVAHV